MKRWILILSLLSPVLAQTNNFPTVIQSASSGGDTQNTSAVVLPDTVSSGQIIAGCVSWQDNCSTGVGSVTVSDSCTSATYTMSSVNSVSVGGGNCLKGQLFYGTVSSSCVPTLTETPALNVSQPGQLSAVVLPSNLTADGSMVSNTYAASPTSVSVTATSGLNGDVGLACSTSAAGTVGVSAASQPSELGASNQTNSPMQLVSVTQLGSAGSQTITHTTFVNPDWIMAGQLFKPTADAIVTTSPLPDAGSGTAYQATLKSIGGSVAPTWSNTAGTWPTGCSAASINSSTGVISCTPTQTGTFSLTFSDGTASATLSLKVGSTLGTPIIAGSPVTGSTVGSWSVPGVSTGDTILVIFQGYDSSLWSGYIEKTSRLTGTLGDTTYTRANGYGGGGAPGFAVYSSKTTAAGTDTITFNSRGVGSPIGSVVFDIHNGQPIIDCVGWAAIANQNTGSQTLTTSNCTTQVPNDLLIAAASVINRNGTATLSINSPFTSITSTSGGLADTLLQFSQQSVTGAGANTATMVGGSLSLNNQVDHVVLIGIRPGIPVAATLLGERRKKRVY